MIRTLSFPEALNLAMVHEMESNDDVFVLGVDVPDHKRHFGSGIGMLEQFGSRRFLGSPLSEAGVTGIAIGAALCGLRPVHVHARADFVLMAMNQLVNMASTKSYISNGRLSVPMVVRTMIGRSWGQGPQHSKSMHSVFAHFPGLKVVMPSDPQDGYSLLRSAIQDNNPVIFLEHRWLYDVVGEVDDDLQVPLGDCKILKTGIDVTILSCSWMSVEAMQAAAILSRYGVEAEVIDVRTIAPLDFQPIINSVDKTGRVVIADNDWMFCGTSAELSAQVTEKCFANLKAAPIRIGFAPVPCPTTRPLENLFYPSAKDIVRAVENLMDIDSLDLSGEVFNEYETRFKGPF